MILTGTPDRTHDVHYDLGDGAWVDKHTLIASPEGDPPAPNGFLIRQSPHYVIRPHYHFNSQFQVVVGGSGRLGNHEVRPLAVHYASRQTGYGPIVAGPEGLAYFTLRAAMEAGAYFLPESNAQRDPAVRKMQVTTPVAEPAEDAQRAARREVAVETLIEPRADGLAAWLLRVPPGAAVAPPAHDHGGGRYCLVGAGTLHVAGQTLPRNGLVWVPDGETLVARSGADGLDLVVMQFPASVLRDRVPSRAAA